MATTATSPKTPRIDARRAALAAADYFKGLYPTTTGSSLEEVELSEDGKFWLITLSFEMPPTNGLAKAMVPFHPPQTKFKVFRVDANTGIVVAMNIRKLE